jgi:hypothetical protein
VTEPVTAAAPSPPAAVAAPEQAPPDPAASAGVGIDAVRQHWGAVLEATKRASVRLGAVLSSGQPVALAGGELTIRFPYAFHAESCTSDQARATLLSVFSEVLGEPLKVAAVVGEPGEALGDPARSTDEAEAVLEAEASEAVGDRPDDSAAHAQAIQTLTRDLGATVLED